MLIYRNIFRFLYLKSSTRCIASVSCAWKPKNFINKTCFEHEKHVVNSPLSNINIRYQYYLIEPNRYYSKKKGSKRNVEESESDDEDEAEEEEYEGTQDEMSENIITKSVPSMRLDTLMKVGFGITKKRVEKHFYANKIRLNGQRVTKKASFVNIGNEIDLVKGYSPENEKFLLIDKIIVKSVGKVTGTGLYPVRMEVLKGLTTENYEDPWHPSSLSEMD